MSINSASQITFQRNTGEATADGDLQISDREIKHHIRYFGTVGFSNADGSSRVPTPEEVVAHGWEPASYLVDPIPNEPRAGLVGVGKTELLSQLLREGRGDMAEVIAVSDGAISNQTPEIDLADLLKQRVIDGKPLVVTGKMDEAMAKLHAATVNELLESTGKPVTVVHLPN